MRANNLETVKVSIVVPVYNAQNYLRLCLLSIENQTHKNIEVILIDDGSVDSSAEICRKMTKKDKRFQLIRSSNQGPSLARNAGLDVATGEYVAFVDADDLIALDYIEYLLRLAMETKAEVSTCMLTLTSRELESSNTGKYITYDWERSICEILYSKDNIINGSFCKLFKTSLFDDIRFDQNVYYAEDLLMNYFVFKNTKSICIGLDKKYYYRIHSGGMMRKKFSTRRMSGLDACMSILADADVMDNPTIFKAAVNRTFMEAAAILLQVPRNEEHMPSRDSCSRVINKYKSTVLLDSQSKMAYRIYALFYYAGISIGTAVVRVVRKIKKEI